MSRSSLPVPLSVPERGDVLSSPSPEGRGGQGVRTQGGQGARTPRVEVVPHEAERRVDVLVDGKPFTSYIYPTTLKKPTLYPLRTASGAVVTRGWPLEPRPGERVDHPHHVGLWFTYSDVNGLDFWNNSDAIPAARAPKMGTILHRSVRHAEGGAGRGVLEVTAEWVDYQDHALLREDTRFVFRTGDGLRAVDRITTLTALGQTVTFADEKDGMLGLRVARSLEQPSTTPEVFTDASGHATPRRSRCWETSPSVRGPS